MYQVLSVDKIKEYQQKHLKLKDEDINLKDLMIFYEENIIPYLYTYECEHELKVRFSFEDENLCHLLYGTVDKTFSNRKNYTGKQGYECIKNETVTFEKLPEKLKKKCIHRIKSFLLIEKILEKPKVIIYNKNMVDRKKLKESLIQSKFLLYRELNTGSIVHLFVDERGNSKKLIPISFFPDSDENYISEQIKFKVVNYEKIPKI